MAAPAPSTPASLESRWEAARDSVKRGDYRQALREFQAILSVTPDDPRAAAYRALCERRLRESSGFNRLSAERLSALQETLRQEQEAQRRADAHAKHLERAIRQEQEQWNRELERYHQEAARAERLKRKAEARAQAVPPPAASPTATPRLEAEGAASRQAAGGGIRKPPEGQLSSHPQAISPSELPPVTPSAGPAGGGELAPAGPPAAPPVEPAPVTPEPGTTEAPGVQPIPELPPGAVQLFADRLSASPDRRLAIAEGNVRAIFDDGFATCDKATFFTDTRDLYAEGRVRIERGEEVFRGELGHINTRTKKGRVLEGTVFQTPWYQHGRVLEHLAEGVVRVKTGYVTTCEFEPPHSRFEGGRATVFANDKIVRGRHVILFAEELPIIYLPWLSVADRQSPFFLIPGKDKLWGYFALSGYRYEWPRVGPGTIRLDWRENFLWGMGLDQRIETKEFGKALFLAYYNEERPLRRPEDDLPKGASINRYRILWRHGWKPLPDTSVVTDYQKFSDADFRRDFLFREEFVHENLPGVDVGGSPTSFVSMVTGDKNFSMGTVVRKRTNRFETVTEAFPDTTVSVRPVPIGETQLFTESATRVANLQTKRLHSDNDTDVVLADWLQQFSYALNLLRPIMLTPKAAVRQTYYTKDKQGGDERPQGERDVISGQFSMGNDASLKLFRIFPVVTNWLRLDITQLRHVLTPTVKYEYIHQPTVPPGNLSFPTSEKTKNQISLGLENKLQTKRATTGKPQSYDLARFIIGLPYTFRGNANKQGGELSDWSFDLELFPWPWLRIESDWAYQSHFDEGAEEERIKRWNLDIGIAGGRPKAGTVKPQLPRPAKPQAVPLEEWTAQTYLPFKSGIPLLPTGWWNLGYSHRYSHNDKTEDLLQFDWRLSEKWQVSAIHRFTWKQVSGGAKRFHNVREYEYVLYRDLHEWIAELLYRVDREYGEEVFFTLTLKAFPRMPVEIETSYHQPKIGSQSSPFSSVPSQ